MDENALLSRLAVSLSIGLLIGLERGWRTRNEEDHQRAAGLRTFALTGLIGGLAGALAKQMESAALVGLIFIGFSAAFTAFHWLEAQTDRNYSATSVIAGLTTFLLGSLAVVGELSAAIAGAVATAVLLALRDQLHRWVASITWPEIRSGLTLLAMTFLLLPVLPNHPIDPWDAINPYEIWLLTILVATVSFVGYVAIHIFGERLGVLMAAVAGGLASSTATTISLADLARRHPNSTALLSGGVLLAGIVMVLRVAIVSTALNPSILPYLKAPLLCGGGALAVGTALMLFKSGGSSEQPNLGITNPLEMRPAIQMGVFIAIVMAMSHILQTTFGKAGVFVAAGVSGLADVDAISISMARMASQTIDPSVAAQAILVAISANTAAKSAMAAWIGGHRIGLRVGVISTLGVTAGVAAWLWLT